MAEVTAVLAAVKAALSTAFPAGTPVHTAKRQAAGGKQQQGGFPFGGKLPALVVSCNEPEEVDRVMSFEHVSLGFVVTVEYVKSAQAVPAGVTPTAAPTALEDPGLRDVRDLIRSTLYRTIGAAVPSAFDTRHKALPPYESTAEDQARVLVSGEEFTFTVLVPRPGA